MYLFVLGLLGNLLLLNLFVGFVCWHCTYGGTLLSSLLKGQHEDSVVVVVDDDVVLLLLLLLLSLLLLLLFASAFVNLPACRVALLAGGLAWDQTVYCSQTNK